MDNQTQPQLMEQDEELENLEEEQNTQEDDVDFGDILGFFPNTTPGLWKRSF